MTETPRRAGRAWIGGLVAAGVGLAAPSVLLPAFGGQERAPGAVVRTTTLAGLVRYPVYFHGHRVRVQAEVTADPRTGTVWLADGSRRVLVTGLPDQRPDEGGRLQVTGLFWDVGRLQPDDPHLSGVDVGALSRALFGREWPGQGELLAIKVDTVAPPDSPPEPTLRALALDPVRYEGKRVTLVGRFRGANLYGDLPAAPGKGRWDFVLQAADAAVWVTGLRPRGRGFDLSPQARVDTGRWLRVSGIVRHADGLVWLEGQTVELADAPPAAESPTPAPPPAPAQAPPPTVIFSAPVQDDTDVPPTTDVRIQFSRDMNPASFEGRVHVRYAGSSEDVGPPAFTVAYRPGPRVLEIRFAAPLDRFRTVRVELGEGIVSSDGLPLAPWTLTFTVGAGAPAATYPHADPIPTRVAPPPEPWPSPSGAPGRRS